MLNALKLYLESNQYTNISLDYMPDMQTQPEAIAIYKRDHVVDSTYDGTGTHLVRIEVRRPTYTQAYAVCKELFDLLNSGEDESLIHLTDTAFYLVRQQRGPLLSERNQESSTFYCEIAFWGEN